MDSGKQGSLKMKNSVIFLSFLQLFRALSVSSLIFPFKLVLLFKVALLRMEGGGGGSY